MFNINDRLKGLVNQIEATGSSLQAKAIGQAHPQPPSSPSSSRPQSPNVAKAQPASSPLSTPSTERPATSPGGGSGTSPTRTYVGSTSALAENALSGLSGLRKSLNFSRPSLESHRPSASQLSVSPGAREQELKDIPTSPVANASRPSSPIPSKGLLGQFALGSDPSSVTATPLPRSPLHGPTTGISRLRSPRPLELPPPDPADPASYPLPPSPTASATTAGLEVPEALYADPLGASPLLPPVEDVGVPAIGLEEATPAVTPDDREEGKKLQAETEQVDEDAGEEGAGEPRLSEDKVDSSDPDVKASALTNGDAPNPGSSSSKELADAERRYEDLSERFTTLLTQKHNADKVLRELTPLEGGIGDHEALEGWVRMVNGKVEMITDEMKRLQGKITLQESRIEELRDTHRLEGTSQTDLISKLRSQLATAESSLASKSTEQSNVASLKADLTKAQTSAKEEEEKRTKAISLLKTVRLKLVKVEKEKEEIEKDRAEERAERSNARDEVERVKAEKEREVNLLRKGFDRELAGQKERLEKDLASKKAAWELDMITTKAAHAKELSGKTTKVNGLEAIVTELSKVKQSQFEDLQSRQAEVESSRSELEILRNRTKELEFQLREANERAAILEDNQASPVATTRDRAGPSRDHSPSPGGRSSTSSAEVQRLLAEAEARAEAKISDLRNKVRSLESERNDGEEEWARKLSERVRELEKMRRVVQEKEMENTESVRSAKDKERLVEEGEEAKRAVEKEVRRLLGLVEEAKGDVAVAAEAERAAREELSTVQSQISALQAQLDEARSHTTTLKSNNRTLRDEMRKIQSSVQLMEKQRNPGVGYWSSSNTANASSPSLARSGVMSPPPSNGTDTGASTPRERKSLESTRTGMTAASSETPPGDVKDKQEEEEVNLEYLRNVILQFLEHKEMRPNLVRVLSVILRFTPQELRRLNAKLSS